MKKQVSTIFVNKKIVQFAKVGHVFFQWTCYIPVVVLQRLLEKENEHDKSNFCGNWLLWASNHSVCYVRFVVTSNVGADAIRARARGGVLFLSIHDTCTHFPVWFERADIFSIRHPNQKVKFLTPGEPGFMIFGRNLKVQGLISSGRKITLFKFSFLFSLLKRNIVEKFKVNLSTSYYIKKTPSAGVANAGSDVV